MKIAEFNLEKIPIELVFKMEDIVRNSSSIKFGTGTDLKNNIREWYLE